LDDSLTVFLGGEGTLDFFIRKCLTRDGYQGGEGHCGGGYQGGWEAYLSPCYTGIDDEHPGGGGAKAFVSLKGFTLKKRFAPKTFSRRGVE